MVSKGNEEVNQPEVVTFLIRSKVSTRESLPPAVKSHQKILELLNVIISLHCEPNNFRRFCNIYIFFTLFIPVVFDYFKRS